MPISVRRFALRVLIFFAPLLLFIGLVEAALWQTGETVPIAQVIKWQQERWRQGRPALWQRGDLELNSEIYKKQMFAYRRPKVVALGSSRVLKFRTEMLGRDGKDFLNCGRMILSVDDLEIFANSLAPDTTPRVVFLGVDHWWLNPNYKNEGAPADDATYNWRAHLSLWRELQRRRTRKMALKRQHLRELDIPKLRSAFKSPRFDANGVERMGIRARLTGSGFRGDGSQTSDMQEPKTLAQWKLADNKWFNTVKDGGFRNEFASAVSQPRLQKLRGALKKLQSKNVLVLVFAPPQISRAIALYETMPGHKDFWRDYLTSLPALCRELDIPYCDATSAQKFGLNDAALFDGLHAEETFYLYILRAWLKDARVRKALPDTARVVETAINSPRTGLWFPDLSAANATSN